MFTSPTAILLVPGKWVILKTAYYNVYTIKNKVKPILPTTVSMVVSAAGDAAVSGVHGPQVGHRQIERLLQAAFTRT